MNISPIDKKPRREGGFENIGICQFLEQMGCARASQIIWIWLRLGGECAEQAWLQKGADGDIALKAWVRANLCSFPCSGCSADTRR
ncbi:hypothetical protein [Sphingobium sp.]|uniref:hypothetical protein n=1 Tax=Sphingobium sp. TaxID=1912891 RepID=UPI00257C9D0F|nr:hypothetical protein [Sphingobium sp.]